MLVAARMAIGITGRQISTPSVIVNNSDTTKLAPFSLFHIRMVKNDMSHQKS